MEIKITCRTGHWTFGTFGNYRFEVKHFDQPSQYGLEIDGDSAPGRISKLAILRGHEMVACYDRGWDIVPYHDGDLDALAAIAERFN